MSNVIAALIIAVGLVGAARIHANGTRYEMSREGSLLLDRRTGTMFTMDKNQQWTPLVTFPGRPAE